MASLLTIPLELLVSVSSYLPTSDLASLRLTCKQVEKSLYEWFSDEFFTKKQFMFTHSSLQTLVDISRHVSFSKKLRHLILATNVYSDIPLRFRDDDAATRYIQGYEDQKALLSTGVDREMLTHAFKNLVNLDTVGIRDFNAPSRRRDGKHATWTSWGATTVYRETGIRLQFSDRDPYTPEVGFRFVTRVFATLLYALGTASRTPPEVEVLLRQDGLRDTAFILPDFLRPAVEPVLHNITTLLLNVDLVHQYHHTHSSGTTVDAHAGRSLRRFLGYTSNLKHLRLNFQKHLVVHNEAFLTWLGQPAPAPGAPSADFLEPAPVALSFLKQLEFGRLNVLPSTLLDIVTKFAPTLEDVCFWRMGLRSNAPFPYGHKPDYWADFFYKMGRVPQLKLTHLKAGMLQQDFAYVNFKTGDYKAKPPTEKEYSGKEMDKFIKELVQQVSVSWPEATIQDNDDDSNSDEDMDDDEYDENEQNEDEDEDDEDDNDDDE